MVPSIDRQIVLYQLYPIDNAPADDIPLRNRLESSCAFARQLRQSLLARFPSVRVCVIEDDDLPLAALLIPKDHLDHVDEIWSLLPTHWST